MTEAAAEMRSVVIEREFAFPAERIWRALTQPHLIEEWLMKNDFKPSVGHRFNIPAGHFKFLRVWSVKFLHPRGRTRDC